MAVTTVVEQAHPVGALRHINPPVRWYFESRLFPTGVTIHWTLNSAILGLAGDVGRADVDIEGCLQQHMLLMPVNMGLEVNARIHAIENNALCDRARAESPLYLRNCS